MEAAIADPTTGDEVKAEHDLVLAKGAFGVPTLVFPDGQALFGPVLIEPPKGDEAIRLWELVTRLARLPTCLRAAAAKAAQRHRRHCQRHSSPTWTGATGSACRRRPRNADHRRS